jgi:hypothetical protein
MVVRASAAPRSPNEVSPTFPVSKHCNRQLSIDTHSTSDSTYTMAGKYELLCLENPLLDIQGVAYVFANTIQA